MILSAGKLKGIVTDSFGVRAYETVLITGARAAAKWIYGVAVECQRVGASPLLSLPSPESHGGKVPQTKFRSVTDDQLLAIAEEIDAWVEVCIPFPRLPRAKRTRKKPEAGVVMPDWIARIAQRGVRQCSFMVPEGPLWVRDAVTKALEADIETMVTLGKKLRKSLASAKNARITTGLGTDLHLALAGTGVTIDCGKWDPELQIDSTIYMPGGVVETLPVETSASGLAVVPMAYLRRAHSGWIRNLKLHFDRGKAKALQSKSGLSSFNRIMEETTGDKDVIAEFGIGVNPNVRNLIGSMKLDELMGGSARVAIGDNYGWLEGKNKSDLHWDFILPKATVELDGKTVLERGRFRTD